MINFVFIFFGHIKSFFINNLNQEKILSINNIKISKFNEIKNYNIKNNNVYYIIFDGMISLENAKKQNIFFKEDKIQKIKKKIINNNLKYIDNSTANYNLTYLTLASIFYFNSPINEMSLKYKNNNFFFPKLLTLNNQNTLNNILKKHNYNFYYFGNNWNECNNNSINNINCYKPISNNNHIQLIETFLRNTPITPLLNILLKRLFGYDKLQNNAQFFLKNYETIIDEINKKNKSSNNFVFIHAMTPHPPYLDKNCKFNDNKNLTKYSFSYECVINKILKITEFLKTNDPTSIIVFQGDHGWNTSIKSSDNFDENIYTQNPVISGKINQNIKNEIYYRSSIFNAIKAPDKCLENLIKPKTNSNTIKFIINCFELKFFLSPV